LGVKYALALLAVFAGLLSADSGGSWSLIESRHFRLYSQGIDKNVRITLQWLEGLRQFFQQEMQVRSGVSFEDQEPVRIIEFHSVREYNEYRLRPTADAYFVGNGSTDYIVLPRLGSDVAAVLAHEYTHLVLHTLQLSLPDWFAEGLAEFYSGVNLNQRHCLVQTDRHARTQTLTERKWLPINELLQSKSNLRMSNRRAVEMFYAQSWLLMHMLLVSPKYSPHAHELWAAARRGHLDATALAGIYKTTIGAIGEDLKAWSRVEKSKLSCETGPSPSVDTRLSVLTSFDSDALLAGLLLASGEFDRARAAYFNLQRSRPDDPALAAALGTIALRQNNLSEARRQWKRAMELGINDANLCYRYAVLAEDAELPAADIADALRHALKLNPDLDDARYKLGLLERRLGNYQQAVDLLSGMRSIASTRAFAYWMAMASALTEIDRRAEAKAAALTAARAASTPEDHLAALQMAQMAETDLTVQMSYDAQGHMQMTTARKPHGNRDWNPFVQPGDHMLSAQGRIARVQCSEGKVNGFVISDKTATVRVALINPSQVLIDGGSAEFICGAEDGRAVTIEYSTTKADHSADGVLRALHFR
jgi:tetratricopeptide (TPR) repeat protein